MVDIKGSVGEAGANGVDDTTLVQAMLVLAKNAAGRGYLERYDGAAGKATVQAILNVQLDQKLIAKAPPAAKAPPPAKGASAAAAAAPAKAPEYVPADGVTPGLVKPNDPTLAKLLALLPPATNDLRTLPGSKTVYLAEAQAAMSASRDAVNAEQQFVPAFRDKVALLVETIWTDTKVVVSICPAGSRRTFEKQYGLLMQDNGVTNAGPGESNHNFGQAVDLGFQGLRWLHPNGSVETKENWWLAKMDAAPPAPRAPDRFWTLLRDTGTSPAIKLNRGPVGDRPHLQAWDDSTVDMARQLAKLMTAVGQAKWDGARQLYKSDLGLGGKAYPVGSAAQIWAGNALITQAQLQDARNAAVAAQNAKAKAQASLAGPKSAAWKDFKPTVAAKVDVTDVKAAQAKLKSDFEAADVNWRKWTPY